MLSKLKPEINSNGAFLKHRKFGGFFPSKYTYLEHDQNYTLFSNTNTGNGKHRDQNIKAFWKETLSWSTFCTVQVLGFHTKLNIWGKIIIRRLAYGLVPI